MKLLYKPFGIIFGLIAGFLSKKVFEVAWGVFDEEEPPTATTREASWGKVAGAAAVQSVAFGVTRAIVNRSGAKSFEYLTGIWPGERAPDKSQAAKAVR